MVRDPLCRPHSTASGTVPVEDSAPSEGKQDGGCACVEDLHRRIVAGCLGATAQFRNGIVGSARILRERMRLPQIGPASAAIMVAAEGEASIAGLSGESLVRK